MDYLILKFPTFDEVLDCNEAYDEMYQKCLDMGIWTQEEMLFQMKIMNIFTDKMENELNNLTNHPTFKYPPIKGIKNDNPVELNKFIDKAMIEIIKGQRKIKTVDLFKYNEEEETQQYKDYKELSTLKNKYVRLTCEGFADGAKNEKLVYYTVYKNENERLWGSYEEFLNSESKLLVAGLSNKVIEFINGFSMTLLRKIARHPSWRTRWISATKTGQSLFKGNISEWDQNKTYLCFWSNLYDSVYEIYPPVEKFILENDERLDNFLESRNKENGKINDSQVEGTRAMFNSVHINPIKKK
jgi:hypothetical protein